MLRFLLILSVIYAINGLKILLIYTTPSPSHNILGHGYVMLLLEAGHEVTYITSKFYNKAHPKLRQIDLTAQYNDMDEQLNLNLFLDAGTNMAFSINELIEGTHLLANMTISDANVQKLINDQNEHFDLVIAEWFYYDMYSGFAAVFNCPFIWSSTLEPNWAILSLVDEATNPAYTVDGTSSGVPPLNFRERLTELRFQIKTKFAQQWYGSIERTAYNEAFRPAVSRRGRVLPPLDEMRYNASLVLSNSYPPLSSSIRLPANFKEIGGYHINAHATPLPEKLQKIMDVATNGVIYFSLGSNVKSKDMPEEMKRDLLKMFGELKQVVLWKFEEELKGLPKNVHILKWAPQPSILAHPNLLVFVSHGGLLSLIETIHYGVPIVGVPVFADQFLNVKKAVSKGYAIKVTLSVNMAASLKNALHDIINDEKYRATAKRLSSIYHDRIVSPGAELVHWVEHVVRTGGALHLRSPALMVPWYQKIYLDLIVIIIAAAFIIKKLITKIFFSKSNRKIKIN